MRTLAAGLPAIGDVSVPKKAQFVLEARALNVREMQELKPNKRYALTVLLIQEQLKKAVDDVADIFIRSMRSLDTTAAERLRQYQLEHIEQGEQLIAQFRNVLTAFEDDGTDPQRVERMRSMLDDDPSTWIERCDEHMAYAGKNYYPFMLQPYRAKRALLFQCLDSLLRKLSWLRQFRSSHREYVRADTGTPSLDLTWLADAKWRKLIQTSDPNAGLVHRKHLELCVLCHVKNELKSGDLYVENSGQYDDYRDHLVTWEEFEAEIGAYAKMLELPADPEAFVAEQKALLLALASEVDEHFPENEHVAITDAGLVLHRSERVPPPEGLPEVDQAITASMATTSILDVLTETELKAHLQFNTTGKSASK